MTKILVSGASGLIGTALVESLLADNHTVLRLTRRPPRSPDEIAWDPTGGTLDHTALVGVDAVVHLAGAGVGERRWTAAYKREIRDSRVLGTRTLVQALRRLDAPPTVLVSASAVGYYGDRGDEILTEASAPGSGFLADVVQAWEDEATALQDSGTRVALARTGLVMAAKGGAFERLATIIRLGAGGPLGNGRQWWPWITLADEVAALRHLLTADVRGPVNLTAPSPERNRDVIKAVASALHRPALVPAPAFALRAVLGEFAQEVLTSQRVVPEVLPASGFSFAHGTIGEAARWLGQQR